MSWSWTAAAISLLPMLFMVVAVFSVKRRLDRDERRDPITTELRLLPAAGVLEQREKLREQFTDRLLQATGLGFVVSAMLLLVRVPENARPMGLVDWTVVLLGFGFACLLAFRVSKDMPQLRRLRLAARAEQAVAQEIGTVLAGQNRLIHDVRAKDFNIDHVVITPAGVFAVETKSRRKPPAGGGAGAVKVRYDGRKLEFPGWAETEPIAQAERQARWLAQHLKGATGEAVAVTPVLALPGWFVENTARISDGMVRVVNPKGAAWLFLPNRPPVLDPPAIQRIAFQVEKLAVAGEP